MATTAFSPCITLGSRTSFVQKAHLPHSSALPALPSSTRQRSLRRGRNELCMGASLPRREFLVSGALGALSVAAMTVPPADAAVRLLAPVAWNQVDLDT